MEGGNNALCRIILLAVSSGRPLKIRLAPPAAGLQCSWVADAFLPICFYITTSYKTVNTVVTVAGFLQAQGRDSALASQMAFHPDFILGQS